MIEPKNALAIIAHLRARRNSAAPRRLHPTEVTMSTFTATKHASPRRPYARVAAALITFLAPTILALTALVGLSTDAALACACGCSVFDVGGLSVCPESS